MGEDANYFKIPLEINSKLKLMKHDHENTRLALTKLDKNGLHGKKNMVLILITHGNDPDKT